MTFTVFYAKLKVVKRRNHMTYDVEYTREIKIASGLVKLVTEKYRINDTTSCPICKFPMRYNTNKKSYICIMAKCKGSLSFGDYIEAKLNDSKHEIGI